MIPKFKIPKIGTFWLIIILMVLAFMLRPPRGLNSRDLDLKDDEQNRPPEYVEDN